LEHSKPIHFAAHDAQESNTKAMELESNAVLQSTGQDSQASCHVLSRTASNGIHLPPPNLPDWPFPLLSYLPVGIVGNKCKENTVDLKEQPQFYGNKLVPSDYKRHVFEAVRHYWDTLRQQSHKQSSSDGDRGGRAAVTGGKQMNGFCELVKWVLMKNGMAETSIFVRGDKSIPGFFRPTKDWDLLVIYKSFLIAAVEFKSQKGPSFGNNFNNRSEEALGNAVDLWTAFREKAFGEGGPNPWLGWIMLLEDCKDSNSPVKVSEPFFKVFDEFKGASYAQRYELLLRKLLVEKFYDGAAFLLSNEETGLRGQYREPATDLTIKRFLAGLAAQARAYLEVL
jgi:hypothetical protein